MGAGRRFTTCKSGPYLENSVWDGTTYLQGTDPEGHSGMSEGLRVQMRKMAEEGEWDR